MSEWFMKNGHTEPYTYYVNTMTDEEMWSNVLVTRNTLSPMLE